MKLLAMSCAALLLLAGTTLAGDLAVSQSTLGSMGLGSMQRMSDDAGMAVRGKGTSAAVWGESYASWSMSSQNGSWFSQPTKVAESANAYDASASWHGKDSLAAGGSLSFAAKVGVEYWADPTGFQLGVAAGIGISGGGAVAAAQ